MIVSRQETLSPYTESREQEIASRLFALAMEEVSNTISNYKPYLVRLLPVEFKPMQVGQVACKQMVVSVLVEEIPCQTT